MYDADDLREMREEESARKDIEWHNRVRRNEVKRIVEYLDQNEPGWREKEEERVREFQWKEQNPELVTAFTLELQKKNETKLKELKKEYEELKKEWKNALETNDSEILSKEEALVEISKFKTDDTVIVTRIEEDGYIVAKKEEPKPKLECCVCGKGNEYETDVASSAIIPISAPYCYTCVNEKADSLDYFFHKLGKLGERNMPDMYKRFNSYDRETEKYMNYEEILTKWRNTQASLTSRASANFKTVIEKLGFRELLKNSTTILKYEELENFLMEKVNPNNLYWVLMNSKTYFSLKDKLYIGTETDKQHPEYSLTSKTRPPTKRTYDGGKLDKFFKDKLIDTGIHAQKNGLVKAIIEDANQIAGAMILVSRTIPDTEIHVVKDLY